MFGFANAGLSFAGMSTAAAWGRAALGIALGLFLGKQVGVFAWGAIRLNLADLPAHATWTKVYGVALLCGIGFTMSLFIGLLAFPTSEASQNELKLRVPAGSLASALIEALLLRDAGPDRSIAR